MKLKGLIDVVARVLDEPARTVNVRAITLRDAGLIRSEGRGLSAADMDWKDAANLLVGCMVGGKSKECDKAVRQIRRAGLKDDGEYSELFGLNKTQKRFSEALPALLRSAANAPSPRMLVPAPSLTIERNAMRWAAHIRFVGGTQERIVSYEARTQKYRDLMRSGGEMHATEIEAVLDGRVTGYRTIAEQMQHQGLWVVARAVADRPWNASGERETEGGK